MVHRLGRITIQVDAKGDNTESRSADDDDD